MSAYGISSSRIWDGRVKEDEGRAWGFESMLNANEMDWHGRDAPLRVLGEAA